MSSCSFCVLIALLRPLQDTPTESRDETCLRGERDDEWRDLYRRISCRYVDAASADYSINETIDQPRALIGVALAAPSRQISDMGEVWAGRECRGAEGESVLPPGLSVPSRP